MEMLCFLLRSGRDHKLDAAQYKKGEEKMKKMIAKFGPMLAATALIVTTVSVNSACTWVGYQPELPKDAKKLRKF